LPTNDDIDAALRALQDENDRLEAENDDLLETQRQLESTQQHYSELFEHAPMAWLTVDKVGTVRNLNQVAVALVGGDRRSPIGSSLFSSVDPDDRQRLREHLRAARAGGATEQCELRLAWRGAPPIPVKIYTRCPDAEGGTFVVALVDLRERYAAEAERERLAQAEREARAANQAKDTFIAMLSHELRTPLTPVLAAASALSESEELPDELRKTLAIIRRNVATEVQLIDDLLDLTRITHGKMRVNKQAEDLHRVVRDAINAVQLEARHAELELTFDLQASNPWVTGDAARLQQVLNNLLRNSIKFTPPGGHIEVRSWNRDRRLLVEVSDDGRGMEISMLPRLFQPFEQALQESLGSAKGLGLGLPICRGILEQHQGTIAASSPGPGRGARFVIDIATIDPPTVHPKATSTPPPLPSRALRVLLVEDHEDTAEIFERLLRRDGYVVHVASSMQAALAVKLDSFDLLLSDVGLSDGNGLELMRTLRKAGDVKGIALSGYGTEEDIRASKAAGFAVHLTKPVDFKELLAAIARLELG
jgi:PAS domain S-box-containing protein